MSFFIILAIIILGRINSSLLGYQFLNTDEFVIGAKALRFVKNDFNFYEFDGDTSGILNAIFLTWPNLLNLDITYLSIRLSAILAISLILYFTYKTIEKKLDKKLVLIIFTPLVLFFSLSKDPDFIHYTNELIATLLIIISLFLILNDKQTLKLKKAFLISFVLGSVLFAKMQFFPVAAMILFFLFVRQYFKIKDQKTSLLLIVGFLSPIALVSTYYYLNSNFNDLFYNVIHYPLSDLITRNLETEKIIADTNSLISISETNKFKTLISHLLYNSVFHLFYFYFFIFLIYVLCLKRFDSIYKNFNFDLLLIISSIIFTLAITLITGSVHRHYLIVLIPMIPIFISIFLLNYQINETKLKKLNSLIFSLSVLFIISLIFEDTKFYSKKFVHSNFNNNEINFYNPKIFSYLKLEDSDKIIIWGWKPEMYILSNLSPASRDVVNQKQIDFKSNREYFKKRFIRDFNKNNPSLVVDNVKPKSYMFTMKDQNVESFNELSDLLSKNYVKLGSINKNCPDLYLRKKRATLFLKKNIDYKFEDEDLNLSKMNDLIVDEDICNTSVIFGKNSPSKFYINTYENRIDNIMILASKKNISKTEVNLKINYVNQKTINEKIIVNKYPFWSNLKVKDKNKISGIEFDVIDLKNKSLGLSELKIFRN